MYSLTGSCVVYHEMNVEKQNTMYVTPGLLGG